MRHFAITSMLVLVTIAHTAAPEQVAAHRDAHRAYLRGLHARGTLVASGPFPNEAPYP